MNFRLFGKRDVQRNIADWTQNFVLTEHRQRIGVYLAVDKIRELSLEQRAALYMEVEELLGL